MFVRSRWVWFRFAENLNLKRTSSAVLPVLSIFYVRIFVSINVLLCNSAGIPIKTSRCDHMHEFIILVLM